MKREDLGDMLVKTAGLLRRVTQERDEALTKVAKLERTARIEKVAAEMKSRGIHTHLTHEDVLADLEKKAEAGQLDMFEEAVKLSSGGLNFTGTQDGAGGKGSGSSEVSGATLAWGNRDWKIRSSGSQDPNTSMRCMSSIISSAKRAKLAFVGGKKPALLCIRKRIERSQRNGPISPRMYLSDLVRKPPRVF